jgi:DNA-binding LytR/AlgR family response regulator
MSFVSLHPSAFGVAVLGASTEVGVLRSVGAAASLAAAFSAAAISAAAFSAAAFSAAAFSAAAFSAAAAFLAAMAASLAAALAAAFSAALSASAASAAAFSAVVEGGEELPSVADGAVGVVEANDSSASSFRISWTAVP